MNLPLDFELTTPRCRLRAPAQADIPHIFSASRHAGFNDGMQWDPPDSEDELTKRYEENLAAWQSGHSFTFSIEAKSDGTFLGRIAIRRTPDRSVWNMGFWLHPSQQGNGFMTEAAQAIVAFGFERLGAKAIEACHATWNVRSRRVLERIGMSETKFVPQGFLKRSEWVPEYRMRIDRKPAPATAFQPARLDANRKR